MNKISSSLMLAAALFCGALVGSAIGGNDVAGAAEESALEAVAVPKGAVVAFNRHVCPAGWSEFTQAEGRTVVGRSPGGTLRGTVGVKLRDKEVRKHNHTVDPAAEFATFGGQHSHAWATFQNGQFKDGTGSEFVGWADGIGATGSGYYPLATDFKGSPNLAHAYHTSSVAAHLHVVDLDEATSTATWHRFPYIQLLMCVRN